MPPQAHAARYHPRPHPSSPTTSLTRETRPGGAHATVLKALATSSSHTAAHSAFCLLSASLPSLASLLLSSTSSFAHWVFTRWMFTRWVFTARGGHPRRALWRDVVPTGTVGGQRGRHRSGECNRALCLLPHLFQEPRCTRTQPPSPPPHALASCVSPPPPDKPTRNVWSAMLHPSPLF